VDSYEERSAALSEFLQCIGRTILTEFGRIWSNPGTARAAFPRSSASPRCVSTRRWLFVQKASGESAKR
jgi:hypothetical protein